MCGPICLVLLTLCTKHNVSHARSMEADSMMINIYVIILFIHILITENQGQVWLTYTGREHIFTCVMI